MSEKSKQDKSKINYKYLQFTLTADEKNKIKETARKENYRSVSDFMRKVVFDYIRRLEHPEFFHSQRGNSIDTIALDEINNKISQMLENQEKILRREDNIEEMRRTISNIYKITKARAYASEREKIIQLLEARSSLSLQQIQAETNIPEDVLFKVISDMNLFKITPTGRFSLR